jgi:hypothetical protein
MAGFSFSEPVCAESIDAASVRLLPNLFANVPYCMTPHSKVGIRCILAVCSGVFRPPELCVIQAPANHASTSGLPGIGDAQ